MRPAELVQAEVRRADLGVDPAGVPARVGAGDDDLLEGGVHPDLVVAHRAAQGPRDDQPVEREHAAPDRAEPVHRVAGRPRRHREQPVPVGREQGAGLEVGADRDQVVDGVVAAGSPNVHTEGGGSTGTGRP